MKLRRKIMGTVRLSRYTAEERGGSIVKGGFVGGEVYRYDADGYVLFKNVRRDPCSDS